jgi:hypothetical protein
MGILQSDEWEFYKAEGARLGQRLGLPPELLRPDSMVVPYMHALLDRIERLEAVVERLRGFIYRPG